MATSVHSSQESSAESSSSAEEQTSLSTNTCIRVLSVTQGEDPHCHSSVAPEETEEIDKVQQVSKEGGKRPIDNLSEWVKWAFSKLQQGVDFNERMRMNKEFRNPGILEKMVAYCELNELGTNFRKEVFDPMAYDSSEYYDELAEQQKIIASREAVKSDRNRERNTEGHAIVSAVPLKKRREKSHSRWDKTSAK
eukprot:jgi/Galph1/5267/GphlegSOOS_G3957.1